MNITQVDVAGCHGQGRWSMWLQECETCNDGFVFFGVNLDGGQSSGPI